MTLSLSTNWEQLFSTYFSSSHDHQSDASHDLSHFQRVAEAARQIAAMEEAPTDPLIILAAAYFHDVVNLPKNHPESKMSSRYSAAKAREVLHGMGFPEEKLEGVCSAIETHSFSAGLPPQTLEAKIIQDADRLESLGALGVMRTFYVSGRMERSPYDPEDLFAKHRPLDDKKFGLDHFYCKLFKLPGMLQTVGGRHIADKRAQFLQYFVEELARDVTKGDGGSLKLVWACYEAGKKNQKLFDVVDPFAEKRQLCTHKYVVDELIALKTQFPAFTHHVLEQLQSELKS